jgi:hypothetical protein
MDCNHGGSARARSLRTDVRNPPLALPAAQRLRGLPDDVRADISLLLRDLSRDARIKAELCWRRNKAPMAAYWKSVAVYANHMRRLLR